MYVNFKDCLAVTLQYEGGYSNHPSDPGGKTNFGVIQRVYNSYRRLKGATPKDVKSISMPEVRDIYKSMYWDNVHGDKLPIGLDLVVFDFGVNSGPSRSIKFLQRALNKVDGTNLKVDGLMGPATLDAATGTPSVKDLITEICDARLTWLRTLTTFGVFGKGWSTRVRGIKAKALQMASEGIRVVQTRPDVPEALQSVPASPAVPVATLTAITGSLGAGILSAVTNPYALAFALVFLGIGAFFVYRRVVS